MKPFIKIFLLRSILIVFFLYSTACVSKGTFQATVDKNLALSENLGTSQGRVKALEKEGEELRVVNFKLKDDLRESRKKLDEGEKRVEALNRDFANERESGAEAIRMLAAEQSEVKQSMQNSLEEWEVDKGELKGRVKAKEMEIKRLELENEELKNNLSETAFEKEKKARELKEASSAHRELIRKLTNEINDGVIKISRLKNSLSVEIVDSIIFDSGSVDIKREGREVLKKMSKVLTGVKENNIRVEGHTDNIPIGKGLKKKYPSNWELSSARATEVVRFLVLQGVGPEKLVPVGFSRFHPLVSNDSPDGRRENRRIEIVLFPRDIQKLVKSVGKERAFSDQLF